MSSSRRGGRFFWFPQSPGVAPSSAKERPAGRLCVRLLLTENGCSYEAFDRAFAGGGTGGVAASGSALVMSLLSGSSADIF